MKNCCGSGVLRCISRVATFFKRQVTVATINEKKIKVISIIEELSDEGIAIDSDRSETEQDAFLKEDGDTLTLSYLEVAEGGRTVSDIVICKDTVTVLRTGAIESEFRFREGRKEKSVYKIPPYSFDVEIYTKKIRNNFTRTGGALSILYEMDIGGAKKRVIMKITDAE